MNAAELTPDQIALIVDGLKQAWAVGGYWGVAAAAVMLLIRIYRKEFIQNALPARFRWSNLDVGVKLALTGLAALGGTFVTAMIAGASPVTALLAALPVALGAIFGHHATELVGTAIDIVMAKVKKGKYVPGTLRRASSIVLPTRPK